jgi:hypothetical protein
MSDYVPPDRNVRPSRKTRRLRFRSSGGEVKLVSQEHLEMICPPSVGEQPEPGRHGGFWVELRGTDDEVKFFRVLNDPIGVSVEIHSPDGEIRREFGPPQDTTFEVLVPDDPTAQTLVLMGEYSPQAADGAERALSQPVVGAQEMQRFDLSEDSGGGVK